VVVAVVVNLATESLSDHGSTRWWAFAAVLLVVGVAVQWWLPVASAPVRRQWAEDNRVRGSFTQRSTGPADQEAHGNDIEGDFGQHQNG